MAKVESFRFWCQKVLPLVYDESLSYYELLCKVVEYLNNTIAAVNENTEDVAQMRTELTQFKVDINATVERLESFMNNYFDNLDVQQEINNKLDEMASDGTLSEIMEPYIDELSADFNTRINQAQSDADLANSRISNIIDLPEGSTTLDAEVADIRVGAFGTTYASAGDAVRGQVSDLQTGTSEDSTMTKSRYNYKVQFIDINKWDSGSYYELTQDGFKKTRTSETYWKTQAILNLPAGTYYYNNIFQNFTIIRNVYTGEYNSCTEYSMETTNSEKVVTINHDFDIFITINTGIAYAMFSNYRLPGVYRFGIRNLDPEFAMYNRTLTTGETNYASASTPQYLMSIDKIDCVNKAHFVACKNPNFNMFYVKYTSEDAYDSWGFVSGNAGFLAEGYKYIVGIVRANDSLPIPTEADAKYVTILESGHIFITVDADKDNINADFASIQMAVNYAASGSEIRIANGEYNEAVDMVHKNLRLIGESMEYTKIVMHTDIYSNPPLEASKGFISNITFYVDGSARPAGTAEDHAYAVHVDYNQSTNEAITFDNCRFIADYTSIGIGLRPDFTLRLRNCIFESIYTVPLFMHNSAAQSYLGPNQTLDIESCRFYGPAEYSIQVQECYDSDNSAVIRSVNSMYVAHNAIPTRWNKLSHVGSGDATISLTADSFGNNAEFMNGSLVNP